MRIAKHLIIDTSSILKASYFAGRDTEFGYEVVHNDKPVWVNGYQHGWENFLNYMHSALRDLDAAPMDCLFVLEGSHGTAIRRNMFADYKKRTERPQQQLDEYCKLEEHLQKFFSRMGSSFIRQDGLESDDVVAYLAKNLKGERVILANDGDMLSLINESLSVRYQSKI